MKNFTDLITLKTLIFTLLGNMFRLLWINIHDMNKRSTEISFHLTQTKQKEQTQGFVQCARHKFVPIAWFTCEVIPVTNTAKKVPRNLWDWNVYVMLQVVVARWQDFSPFLPASCQSSHWQWSLVKDGTQLHMPSISTNGSNSAQLARSWQWAGCMRLQWLLCLSWESVGTPRQGVLYLLSH
jgi:hypothetical protein